MKWIEDYGLIGDGQTAALVARDGTIAWLCMPRFDSEACLASLLGSDANGYWRLAPEGEVTRSERRYCGDTLILETIWATAEGEVAVIDFMPMRGEAPDVVRIVEGRTGRVKMRSALAPRFDYGRVAPLVRRRSAREVLAIAGPNALILRADVDIGGEDGTLESAFAVRAGERVCFAMTWFPSHESEPDPLDPPSDLVETERYWSEWVTHAEYDGPYRSQVIRSLLTLKALVYAPTGAIVAAPTTSLPEQAGGTRNWDYRFCWLRDATLALLAFEHTGFQEEARAWVGWLRRTLAGEPVQIQPLYTVTGRRHTPEQEADWLTGFNGAQPVRLGNAAVGQVQLDVFGEVLDALFEACRHGEQGDDDDALFRLLVGELEHHWREPDAGFWESRGEPKHHVHSKVMCWVAFNRAARWFEHDPALAHHYAHLASEVKAEVLERGLDPERGCFTRAYDDRALDAAALRLPLVGFLPADDPRIIRTVEAIERELLDKNGFARRYRANDTDDGVGGEEGAFVAASFWLASVYAMQGRNAEARGLFDRLCRAANDLGLMSEEIGSGEPRLLGNFPQALSHLSLVGTALALAGETLRGKS